MLNELPAFIVQERERVEIKIDSGRAGDHSTFLVSLLYSPRLTRPSILPSTSPPVRRSVGLLTTLSFSSCLSFSMFSVLTFSLLLGLANAHLAAWHRAMYCLDVSKTKFLRDIIDRGWLLQGVDGHIDLNTAAPVTPLYQLSKNDWWCEFDEVCQSTVSVLIDYFFQSITSTE